MANEITLRAQSFAEQILAALICAILAITREKKFGETYKILTNREKLFHKI